MIDNNTEAQNADEQAVDKSSSKVKIKSISALGKEKKRKILIIGIGGVVALTMLSQLFIDKPVKDKIEVSRDVGFIDTTPTPISVEKLTVGRLQSQLDAIEAAADKRNKDQTAILERLSNDLKAQADALGAKTEAQSLQIKQLQEQLEKQKSEAKNSPSTKNVSGGNPYLMPPLPDTSSAIVPPPSLNPSDKELANKFQAQSDSSPVQDTRRTVEHWTQLPKAIVLSAGGEDSRNNVLKARKVEKDSVERTASSFLPMGAFASVSLVTGGDFGAGTTSKSSPQPVLMRISEDAFLPNDGRYKLRHCAALGSGFSELSSERVNITITRISCVDVKTGLVLEAPIVAYVADTDGKQGMRGKLVNREGSVLAKALLAGFVSGASEILSAQAQNATQAVTGSGVVTTFNPDDVGKAGAYSGASKATEMLAQRYMDQADAIHPVIEVNAGRRGTIVVQAGTLLKWQAAGISDKG